MLSFNYNPKVSKLERLDFLDELAGLLILSVILGHAIGFAGLTVCNRFNPIIFFMFWFYFKSGMFYRPKEREKIAIGGAKKLLLTFVVYSFIGYVVDCLGKYISGDREWEHYILVPIKDLLLRGSISGNLPLWFLFSLYCVQVIFNELYIRQFRPIYIFYGGLLLASLAYNLGLKYPYYLSTVSLGLAAYSFGYTFREWQYTKKCLFISSALYLVIFILYPSFIDFRDNSLNDGGNYMLAVVFSLSGCIVFNNIFRKLPNCIFLQFIGKNAMEYYVIHWIILNICYVLCSKFLHWQGISSYCLMVFLSVLIPTMFIKIKSKTK